MTHLHSESRDAIECAKSLGEHTVGSDEGHGVGCVGTVLIPLHRRLYPAMAHMNKSLRRCIAVLQRVAVCCRVSINESIT